MSKIWRFFLGGAIGVGLGYAAVLLLQPKLKARRGSHLRTIYQAPAERKEEQPAA